MLSKTSIILIVICVALSILDTSFINSTWFDIIISSLFLGAIVISKDRIIESNEVFGKYIYYGILGALLFFIYIKWF